MARFSDEEARHVSTSRDVGISTASRKGVAQAIMESAVLAQNPPSPSWHRTCKGYLRG